MEIDWLNVFYNSLWILGLAIILAAFSFADWQAHQAGVKLRSQFNSPAFQRPLSMGLILVSVSLAFLADRWWEQVIWAVFGVLFALQLWIDFRQKA